MKKILGIGNALVDILVKLPNDTLLETLSLPKGSMQLVNAEQNASIQKHLHGWEYQLVAGGATSNTMRGLGNLGVTSDFIGMIGNDEMGKKFEYEMESVGVGSRLFQSINPTGTATTFISNDCERTFATYLGAAIELDASLLHPDLFKGYSYFHIEGYLLQNHELIKTAIQIAKAEGLKISLDMASYNVVETNIGFLKEIIGEYVDIVFANEEESFAFSGMENPVDALNYISDFCEITIVKVGRNGSLIKHQDKTWKIPAIEADAVDTTGAGDLYAAGFLYGLTENCTLENCGHIGKILAGNVVEVIGVKMDEQRWQHIKLQVSEILNH